MKYEIPTEAQMKLEHARQIEYSIERLKGYEEMFSHMSIDFHSVPVPSAVKKRLKDWVESQILIEKSHIQNYGKQ